MIAERIDSDFLPTRTATTGNRFATATLPRPDTHEPRPQPQTRDVRPRNIDRTRPMGQRGPLVVRQVRALGWRSPETLAILVASFLVSLAAIYVAAYARVAADGVEEARLHHASRLADEQKDELLARVSELSLASDVQRTAAQMNMAANDPKSEQLLTGAATTIIAPATTPAEIANVAIRTVP